jgi:hypothetical protein
VLVQHGQGHGDGQLWEPAGGVSCGAEAAFLGAAPGLRLFDGGVRKLVREPAGVVPLADDDEAQHVDAEQSDDEG